MKALGLMLAVSWTLGAAEETVSRLVWVVSDLDKSVAGWSKTGTPASAVRKVALAGGSPARSRMATLRFSNVEADLIEPAAGDGLLAEFARRRGQGVYSLVYAAASEAELEARKKDLAARGAAPLFEMKLEHLPGRTVRYCFFDTAEEGKFVLGLAYDSGGPAGQDPRGARVTQFAFVARDLERVSAYWQRLGFPAMTYSHPETSDLVYRGKPGRFSMRLGWQRHTPVPFEWIQALEGPSTYHEHLAKYGEGFHHLAFNVENMDEAIRQWASWGYPLSMGGAWGEKGKPGSGRFAYHDLDSIGGAEIELLWNYRPPASAAPPAQASGWTSLFDGRTMGEWGQSGFPRQPEARVSDGAIVLPAGAPLTGVTWRGAFPKTAYEIRFEAAKLNGGDFFASLTFPVDESFATWVLGGRGGDIVGISSLDGRDASENETRSYFEFETNKWYKMALKVERGRIQGWIDGQRVVDLGFVGREISLRPGDIRLSAPLGFASYNTAGAVRAIEYRALTAR